MDRIPNTRTPRAVVRARRGFWENLPLKCCTSDCTRTARKENCCRYPIQNTYTSTTTVPNERQVECPLLLEHGEIRDEMGATARHSDEEQNMTKWAMNDKSERRDSATTTLGLGMWRLQGEGVGRYSSSPAGRRRAPWCSWRLARRWWRNTSEPTFTRGRVCCTLDLAHGPPRGVALRPVGIDPRQRTKEILRICRGRSGK